MKNLWLKFCKWLDDLDKPAIAAWRYGDKK